MIEKTLNNLCISGNNISTNNYETIDPRPNENSITEKNSKKTKKDKKNIKQKRKQVQVIFKLHIEHLWHQILI